VSQSTQLSIVVCTRNRAARVAALVGMFDTSVRIPASLSLQIVVVDNCSTDDTADRLMHLNLLPHHYELLCTKEEKSGLSHARNRGIAEARFDRICFLDDDVVPRGDFLERLAPALLEHADAGAVVFRIIYEPTGRPRWFRLDGRFRIMLGGGYDLGDTSRYHSRHDPVPIGAGMVLSKEMFRRFGMFDPAFGYDTSRAMLVPGEESELFLKIIQARESVYYAHDAVIRHCPEADKFSVDILRKTYRGGGYWYGSRDARVHAARRGITVAGLPPAYYRRLGLAGAAFVVSRLWPGQVIRRYCELHLEKALGFAQGYRDYARSNKRGGA